MTESSKQHTLLIPNWWIIIKLCVLELIRNLFCILKNIPTIVAITSRRENYGCRVYIQLIIINTQIGTKLLYGISGKIESEARGGVMI